MLPPAACTALIAAWLSLLVFSIASFSRLAFVLELPLGATPVKIFMLSSGVKFTKSTFGAFGVLGAPALSTVERLRLKLRLLFLLTWKEEERDLGLGDDEESVRACDLSRRIFGEVISEREGCG